MMQPISVPLALAIEERELVRQLQVTRLLLEEMGGGLPRDQIMAEQLATVLDVACGAGGWVLDVTSTYPHLQVIGLDRSEPCVVYAQQLADAGELVNAHFLTHDMHALEMGPFDPASFDLVNVAFIAHTLLTTDYATLMRSLLRLCRPGGIVRWTEMELPITNGPAFEQLMALTCRALQTAGHTFTPLSMQECDAVFAAWRRERGLELPPVERRHLGITPMMGSWLRQVGCCIVEYVPTAIEVSTGTAAHPCFVRQVEVFGQQIAPFLCEQEVIAINELAHLLTRVQKEIQQENFCGLCFLLTANGYKEG